MQTVAEAIKSKQDKRLASSALTKQQSGEEPTARELAALKRVEKRRYEEALNLVAKGIPKKKWCEWSGRQHKVLLEQAAKYGAPFDEGEMIPLQKLAKWLHDFLSKNKYKLASGENGIDGDPLLAGVSSPALERYREQRAILAKLDVQEREETLIPRENVHLALSRFAGLLRQLGETYRRQFEPEVGALLDATIDDWEKEMSAWFTTKEQNENNS